MDKEQLHEKFNRLLKQVATYTVTPQEIKQFLELVLNVIKNSKDSFDKLSAENLQTIKDNIAYIEEINAKAVNSHDIKTNAMVGQMEAKLALLKALIAKVQLLKPTDGKDADETKIVAEVLSKIPKVEIPETTGEIIVDKINELNLEKENQIDFKHLKNVPKFKNGNYYGGSGIKEIIAGTNITVDNTNLGYPVITAQNDATAVWGSITGTLSSQTDLQTALNGKANSLGADDNYVTDAQLVVIGNTSGVNTGNQDLSGYAPLASPTFVTNITSPLIIGGTAVGSNIIYKSTTGIGTPTGVAHQWLGGTNGATVIATMLNNGNVGIGTTAPVSKLDVVTSGYSYVASPLKGTGMNLVGAAGTGVGGGDGTASGVLNIIDSAGMGINNGGTITLGGNYISSGNAYGLTYAGIKGGKENVTDYNSAGYLALFTTPVGAAPTEKVRITSTGNVGIGTTTGLTAKLNLAAGTASVAPLLFNSGTLLTTPLAGSVEFLTDKYYGTITTGAVRKEFAFVKPATSVTIAAAATTFAITSDVVTVTGDALANIVATITGGVSGQRLTLLFVDALVTITDTAAATADTVNLSAAFVGAANTTLTLVYNGNKWFETGRSVN